MEQSKIFLSMSKFRRGNSLDEGVNCIAVVQSYSKLFLNLLGVDVKTAGV